MSCLQNIFNKQQPEVYMEYKYYDFDYAQNTMAKIEENNKIVKLKNYKNNLIDLEK